MDLGVMELKADDVVEARPFTHPRNSLTDAATLQYMLGRLCEALELSGGVAREACPVVMVVREPDGRKHRMVVCSPDELSSEHVITVVGFFGTRRPGADRAPLDEADEGLIAGFPEHPGLLSYCSMEVGSGNWANLVLMRDSAAVDHWASSTLHTYAAKILAPGYYACIRLHNGSLEGGIASGRSLRLHRTKYYDFAGDQTWRAVRETISG